MMINREVNVFIFVVFIVLIDSMFYQMDILTDKYF